MSYLETLEKRSRRGRYMIVKPGDVGVPYEGTIRAGHLGARIDGLTHAQELAGGMDLLLARGWRFVCTIGGSSDLMVFESVDPGPSPDLDLVDALRESLKNMHRRAQASEGAATREKRLRAGFEKERAMLIGNTRFWEKRYQDLKLLYASEHRARVLALAAPPPRSSFWSRFF